MFFLMMMTMLHPVLPAVKHTHKHIVIAHRGDHVSLPENTLAAYTSAINLGVDYIETDVRTAANGELVIKHSSVINNEPLPTFKEVLQLCHNKVNIYLDFKDADVKTTYKMICEAKMQKQVVVYANTLAQLKEWNEVAPDMPVMTSVPENNIAAFLDKYVIAAVDGSIGQYTPTTLALFKSRGIAVWLDVQDKEEGPATWNMALKEGIQGLQTDHPAALLKYLQRYHR